MPSENLKSSFIFIVSKGRKEKTFKCLNNQNHRKITRKKLVMPKKSKFDNAQSFRMQINDERKL